MIGLQNFWEGLMYMKKRTAAMLLLAVFCITLAGCSAKPERDSAQPAAGGWEPLVSSSAGPASPADATPEPAAQPTPMPGFPEEGSASTLDGPGAPASQPEDGGLLAPVSGNNAPTLPPEMQDEAPSGWEGGGYPGDCVYVGTKSGGFMAYPSMLPEKDVTPEALIARIADLTGWDLTLAEDVTTGKGGMSVCLASTSSLFTGPPEKQKDEFHIYGADQMAETVLDSIQKTLQEGFTGAGGNPDNIDIYFYMEGEKPLSLPNVGLSWPLDQPYQWSAAEQS